MKIEKTAAGEIEITLSNTEARDIASMGNDECVHENGTLKDMHRELEKSFWCLKHYRELESYNGDCSFCRIARENAEKGIVP